MIWNFRAQRTSRGSEDQPWRVREAWCSGRIRSDKGGDAFVLCAIAVCFGGLSSGISWTLREHASEGIGAVVQLLLFPVVASFLAVWAISSVASWYRFRNVLLELSTLPGAIGGNLKGVIHLGRLLEPEDGFCINLYCLRTRRRGSETCTSVEWEHKVRVPVSSTFRGTSGTVVPLSFDIPSDIPESRPGQPRRGCDRVTWKVHIAARVPGANLSSHFEVPVFRTGSSSASEFEAVPHVEDTSREKRRSTENGRLLLEQLASSLEPLELKAGIRLREISGGGLECYFGPLRHKSVGLVLTIFGVLFLLPALFYSGGLSGAWLLLLAPTSLVGVAFGGAALLLLLHTRTVVAEPGSLTISERVPGYVRTTQFRAEEIRVIQVAPSAVRNKVPWEWQILVAGPDGKKESAGDGFRSEEDARRTADVFELVVHGKHLAEAS